MKDTWNYQKGISPGNCLILFFAGLLAGILFVHTLSDDSFAGIFSEYFLNQYASLEIDSRKLFRYVFGYRCGQYALLVCCGAVSAAPVLLGASLFFLGMTWGTMISVSTVRLGLKGVLICVAGVIPQILFYLPAFGWILLWIWNGGSSRKKYWFFSGAGFFFLLSGIVTEVYLNPLLLQQILQRV
ncbi:MAG: stage II sporulation protein M [Lachnospiraceae bacterium]|nr:stage II sporulation protein M [Lachnospiraceae bacterium]